MWYRGTIAAIKFKLDNFESEKTLVSARLSIYKLSVDNADTHVPGFLHAAKILKSWDYSTYNWQLRASGKSNFIESGIVSKFAYDSVDNRLDTLGWVHIDATAYIQSILNGSANNGVGITAWPYEEIEGDSSWHMYHKYASIDNSNVGKRPKLTIVTTNGAVANDNVINIQKQNKTTVNYNNGVMIIIPNKAKYSSGDLNVDIHSVSGRCIYSFKHLNLENGAFKLNLRDKYSTAVGNYFIRVYNKNSSTIVKLAVI